MPTKRVLVDRRRSRHERLLSVRIRLMPAPKGHDFDAGFDTLLEINRRALATANAKGATA